MLKIITWKMGYIYINIMHLVGTYKSTILVVGVQEN